MGKRAAGIMNHRAAQLEGVAQRMRTVYWQTPSNAQGQFTVLIQQLETITEAIRADAKDEYERGQEWFREHQRKEEARRKRERAEVRKRVGGVKEEKWL